MKYIWCHNGTCVAVKTVKKPVKRPSVISRKTGGGLRENCYYYYNTVPGRHLGGACG